MAIVRDRDYWQAKRDIKELEVKLAELDKQIDATPSECKYEEWATVFNELAYLKECVAQHEGEPAKRPCDMERPESESTLSQWVSA